MFKRSAGSFYACERSFLNNQIKAVNNKIALSKDFMRLIGYFLAEGHIAEDTFDIKAHVNINKDNSTNVSAHNKIIQCISP